MKPRVSTVMKWGTTFSKLKKRVVLSGNVSVHGAIIVTLDGKSVALIVDDTEKLAKNAAKKIFFEDFFGFVLIH